MDDALLSRPSSGPPSSSSGFDLASRASDFASDFESDDQYNSDRDLGVNWGQAAAEVDMFPDYRYHQEYPHYGYCLLGAPGFDLDEFLDACGPPLT